MTPEELIARLRTSLLEEETSDDVVLAYAQIVPPFAEIKEFYQACFDNQLDCRLLDEKHQPDPNNPLFCIRRERDIQAEQQPLLDWLEQTLKDGSVPQVILTSQQVFPLFRSAPELIQCCWNRGLWCNMEKGICPPGQSPRWVVRRHGLMTTLGMDIPGAN